MDWKTGHDAEALSDWREAASKSLPCGDVESLKWEACPGISCKPLYLSSDIIGLPYADTLPGYPPYVRGPQATMYSGRPWTIRQYAGFSTAEASNQFFKNQLSEGAEGISIAFDLPSHRGYDSDHPLVSGDVGKTGIAIDTVEDMKILLRDIPLNKVSVSLTISGAVLPILASFIVAAEEYGFSRNQLTGTVQNDILKEYLVRNAYIYPPVPSMRIVGDVISSTAMHMPRFNAVSVSGYHMQEAGADQVLELALTLANGKEYVRTAVSKGLNIDDLRLSFFWGVGMNFYVEVAKMRAARLLWYRIMHGYGARNPKSLMLRTHCQTSGWSLVAQDPLNNIVRTTIEALAAIFGGTQSLHTNAFDEAHGLPTKFSARIAQNTQLIIRHETQIPNVVDPWGGSYMMEALTEQVANAAWEIIEKVESRGGMIKVIENGWAKEQIDRCAAQRQARIDSCRDTIVGLNKYQPTIENDVDTFTIDDSAARTVQIRRLHNIRNSRDGEAVAEALGALKASARTGKGNLLDLTIAAIRHRSSVGEVSSALEEVWGRHRMDQHQVVGAYTNAFQEPQVLQELSADISEFINRHGRRPRLLIAKLGQDGHDRGAKVVATAFADIGFDVDIGPMFQTAEDCARQAIENDVHAIGVSTLTGGHKVLIPSLITSLHVCGGEDIVVFVGGIVPRQDYEFLLSLGVKGIFGPGTSIPDSARTVLEQIRKVLPERCAI